MATYLRLYVSEFTTSNGRNVYGGKRHSSHPTSHTDLYYGSGTVIGRAVKKYGRECIICVNWSKTFETPELLKEAEELLIDELHDKYENCVNLVKGGAGGRSYYNPSDNPSIGQKRSDETKKRMSDSAKTKIWSEDGLRRRREATIKMTAERTKFPDFKGGKNPAARKIIVGDLVFSTGKECAVHFNISAAAVIGRCKTDKPKWKHWRYYDDL